jgi:acetyl-CoA carboxylase carboxyl transferase subunit alpha
MDFISALFSEYLEIHGDRRLADDPAVSCGMARYHDQPVMVIGTVKGKSTKEKIHHKFGMPDPEGYRKALRAMKIAEKFKRSVVLVLDTPGAWPGTGAEERGQGEAIARNIFEMSKLRVPTIAIITGEGMSGGVLGLAVADRILLLENSILSLISPEGCAAITWKDNAKRKEAAAALKYSAHDALELGVVDEVIPEPQDGIQANPASVFAKIDERLQFHLQELQRLPLEELLQARHEKFRNIASFFTENPSPLEASNTSQGSILYNSRLVVF